MYEMGYDLFVDDEGVVEEAESLYQKADLFEQNLGQLVAMLEATLDDALIHGMVATNLARFLEEVRSLQTEAEEIAVQLKEGVTEYVAEIDTADNYLY